jgi:hypothetical protein
MPRSAWIDAAHYEECRGCQLLGSRADMVPAHDVLRPTATGGSRRGWYCPNCAARKGWHPKAQGRLL